jgi:hypothetical protein
VLCLQQELEKGRVGVKGSGDLVIVRDRRDRKSETLPLINTDDTDQNQGEVNPTAEGGGATRVW